MRRGFHWIADFGRTRLERRIQQIDGDHTVNGRTEVDLQGLAARGALDLHLVCRHPEAARQRPVVELQDEIAAAALVWHDRAGDVVPPVPIGRGLQTRWCHHTYAGQSLFAVVLPSVAILVVEDLALSRRCNRM